MPWFRDDDRDPDPFGFTHRPTRRCRCGRRHTNSGSRCDDCIVDAASAEMEALTDAFDGDSERAVRYLEGLDY